MGDDIEVDTADLRAKATQLDNVEFGDARALSSGLAVPDTLASTLTAVNVLRDNATYLAANQEYAETEGRRLAETLRSVADAYDQFDEAARRSVDGTGPPPTPLLPKAVSIPKPRVPELLTPPDDTADEEPHHVDVAQQMLCDGDGGTSLANAKLAWDANGVALQQAAGTMQSPIRNWEGQAAEAALTTFEEYGAWLTKLGQSWQMLSQRADHIARAHLEAVGDHTPVFQQYETLLAAMGVGNQVATMVEMEKLQHQSELIQSTYANAARVQPVSIDSPPSAVGGVPHGPVTANGASRRFESGSAGRQASSDGPDDAGAGHRDGKSSPPSARPPSAEPAGRQSPGAGGGPPSGGGGSPLGGLPGLPNVRGSAGSSSFPGMDPAAVHGGGAAGGGGGGGGRPSMPLEPSVGGVSVGPGPAGGVTPGATPAGTGGTASGAMGAAGAPMAGHGRGEGKDKRRAPGLSPDEALYTEDRQYTEEVIGARKRRTLQDSQDPR